VSWNPTGLSVSCCYISDITIDPQNPDTVYAVMSPRYDYGGGIWKTIDGGTNWTDLSFALPALPNTIALDLKNSRTIYAATDFGVIVSADAGGSWTLLTSATGITKSLTPASDSTLYAGGSGGLFAISSALPAVTTVSFDVSEVRTGESYTATITGSNLNNSTYLDVQVRAPGSVEDILVLNWQMGISESHAVSAGVLPGTWTIDGVRAHRDPENHTASLRSISATITVIP
jgi:hypothetical protein